ncbi:MAG: phospholipase D-like domain-containing protein [Chloroflexota bacterium]|nr:phospholipase D-like domain-containing protein [Chloroflexota bacterium]
MTNNFNKPEFIDNRDGREMLAALRGHLNWLADTYKEPVSVDIATGYFHPAALALLADQLRATKGLRLLLGAEPTAPPKTPRRQPGDKRGRAYEAQRINAALKAVESGLREDRDILGFSLAMDETMQKLLDFLASEVIEVRRYSHGFLHGKAYLFSDHEGEGEGVIAGSSNLTPAGLASNRELNLGHYEPRVVEQVAAWFEDMWAESEPYDLAAIYQARFEPYDPYLIYLRALYELYGDELRQEIEAKKTNELELTSFQNDGLFRARRILDNYNGVIIADGVGLGKTFIGGELIRDIVYEQRQRVLLIAPAVLRDGAWDWFKNQYSMQFEVLSYQEFAELPELGGKGRRRLHFPVNDYQMIIIDEAHALRNPDTTYVRALRRLLQGHPPKKLVLMTATPVNNSLWDLYNLLSYFVGHDAAFANQGIRSLRGRFKSATDQDPYDLRPDTLFDVLDETTVRRTRHFIKKYYPNEPIPGMGGQVIRFPEPIVKQVEYSLDAVLPGFFDDFAEALAPAEGDPKLTLARYWPSRYRHEPDPEINQREAALVGLLRSGLLKRFESSVNAFARTAKRMADSQDRFLAAMDRGFVLNSKALGDWSETDNDEALAELLADSGSESIELYREADLRRDIEADRDILRRLSQRAFQVERETDPKLEQLVEELAEIAAEAEREAINERELVDKRKVVIFCYFSDTVGWIEKFLFSAVESDSRLAAYRGRVVSVSSSERQHSVNRRDAVFGFVPRSTRAPNRSDRFDILITTDVLAEGENLQQCRHIVNYDLPWNPMRLVQRNGRINRIGSPHLDVFIRCFFPDRELDALLALEERIRAKLEQAARSIGVEDEVIPKGAVSQRVFTETREQIEALRHEDAGLLENNGEGANAYSGEEYRQELRQGLDEYGEELTSLPWAVGAGFKGLRRGHFFCARIGDTPYLRFVPADGGDIIDDRLGCLRLVTCEPNTERHLPDDMRMGAYAAWDKARDHIHAEWTFFTDPANVQPKVSSLLRRAAQHLRANPPLDVTPAYLNAIVESLEAPLSRRLENSIREVFKPDSDDRLAVSAAIIAKVQELGLQPFRAPNALPPIDQDEIQLIAWMAVDQE